MQFRPLPPTRQRETPKARRTMKPKRPIDLPNLHRSFFRRRFGTSCAEGSVSHRLQLERTAKLRGLFHLLQKRPPFANGPLKGSNANAPLREPNGVYSLVQQRSGAKMSAVMSSRRN